LTNSKLIGTFSDHYDVGSEVCRHDRRRMAAPRRHFRVGGGSAKATAAELILRPGFQRGNTSGR